MRRSSTTRSRRHRPSEPLAADDADYAERAGSAGSRGIPAHAFGCRRRKSAGPARRPLKRPIVPRLGAEPGYPGVPTRTLIPLRENAYEPARGRRAGISMQKRKSIGFLLSALGGAARRAADRAGGHQHRHRMAELPLDRGGRRGQHGGGRDPGGDRADDAGARPHQYGAERRGAGRGGSRRMPSRRGGRRCARRWRPGGRRCRACPT